MANRLKTRISGERPLCDIGIKYADLVSVDEVVKYLDSLPEG